MKTVEFQQQVRPLLPVGERWEFQGSFCYRAPVGLFAFGVLNEGSASDRGAYLWSVSMPLFLPSEHINLSYSDRVGGGSRKYSLSDVESLSAAIREAVAAKRDEKAELRRLVKMGQRSPNIRLLEAAANSAALLDAPRKSLRICDRASGIPLEQEWEREVAERLLRFGHSLRVGGGAAALELLHRQARATAAALGLAI